MIAALLHAAEVLQLLPVAELRGLLLLLLLLHMLLLLEVCCAAAGGADSKWVHRLRVDRLRLQLLRDVV